MMPFLTTDTRHEKQRHADIPFGLFVALRSLHSQMYTVISLFDCRWQQHDLELRDQSSTATLLPVMISVQNVNNILHSQCTKFTGSHKTVTTSSWTKRPKLNVILVNAPEPEQMIKEVHPPTCEMAKQNNWKPIISITSNASTQNCYKQLKYF